MEKMNFRYIFMKNGEFGGYACSDLETVNEYLTEILIGYERRTIVCKTSLQCDHDLWKVFDNEKNCFVEFDIETIVVIRAK